jgi:hypothetical protein
LSCGRDKGGARRITYAAHAKAIADRMRCPPAGIKAARHGIEATLRGIHCLLGETHPVASGIHCPADETHATPHRKHAITRRIRSTTRRFFPGELRGDVLHGRLTVRELSERGVFVRQDQPAVLRFHVDAHAGREAGLLEPAARHAQIRDGHPSRWRSSLRAGSAWPW